MVEIQIIELNEFKQLLLDGGWKSTRKSWGRQVRGYCHGTLEQVRQSVSIDWTLREGARAKIRVMVKRILNKYGYPPDLQAEAVKTVLMQAELLCKEWAA